MFNIIITSGKRVKTMEHHLVSRLLCDTDISFSIVACAQVTLLQIDVQIQTIAIAKRESLNT